MAADYTRTIVFKVEDQAIKRATNQIVTSLKRIETVLEKIHQKGFSKIAADADKVASGIDKATAALNKYNKELARAQKQKALPAAKELLEPGATKQPGRLRRVGQAVERAALRVAGTVGIAGGAGLTAYVAAIRAVNVSVNKAISISPKFANFLGLVEQKTNGLTIATNVLRDAYTNHPITAGLISVALVALGIDYKKATTAAMWFGRVTEKLSRPVRKLALDFNPIEAALNRITGQTRITSKALMGLGGVKFNPIDSLFPIDASKRTIDVTPIQGGESGKGYTQKITDRLRFSEAQRARGNDLRQKLGMRGRIIANVEASRRSRAASGFADFEADLRGLKTVTAKDAIVKSIERKNRRLVKLKKSQLNIDKLLNKNMRKRLGMSDEAIAFERRLERMFTKKARKSRRRGAQERLFSMRTGMDPREAENLMLGFGFPMLFGGGVGAVGGGVGGAALGNMMGMQGFGTQIIGSALGTAVDSFVTATAEVGRALGEFVQDTGALIEAMGIAGTAEAQRIKNIERLKGEQAAFDATVKRLTATIGETGVQRLKDFGEKWTDLMMLMQTKLLKLRQAVAGILLGLDNLMGYSKEARNKRMMVFAREQGSDEVKKLVKEYDEMSGGQLLGISGKRKRDEILDKVKPEFDKMSAQAAIDRNLGKGDKTPQEKLKAERDRLELVFQYGEREAAIRTKINELKAEGIEHDADAIRKTMEQTYALQDMNELYKGIGQTIKDGLVEGINAAIDGTKTLGEIASSVFRQISNQLISYGINASLGSIPGLEKIFGRASGGPVKGGSPYIVGEKGPELFVPGSSGNIVPNHAMGGTNVVVNVDASGSSVEGDGGQAEELGGMLAAAVQAEIANQQRPGGLLAGTR